MSSSDMGQAPSGGGHNGDGSEGRFPALVVERHKAQRAETPNRLGGRCTYQQIGRFQLKPFGEQFSWIKTHQSGLRIGLSVVHEHASIGKFSSLG